MFKLKLTVMLLALAPSLSGCEYFLRSYQLDWSLLKTETVIDPISGDKTLTHYWKYEDGHQTTTTEVIKKDTDNDRRIDVRPSPPARFSD